MKIGNLGCVPLQVMWPFHLKRQTHPGPPPQRIMWPYASGSYKSKGLANLEGYILIRQRNKQHSHGQATYAFILSIDPT
jgi:hypothetical protein